MSKIKTGDQGQRYEVIAINNKGKTIKVGWTEIISVAEEMAAGVNLHPAMCGAKIIDRRPK